MTSDPIHERGRALEDRFFQHMDQKLLQKMKAEMEAAERKKNLAAASGIDDDDVLEKLVDAGISSEALTSLSMVPLVAMAWADGKVRENERDAIMRAAAESGIVSSSASYGILESWLNTRPEDELLDTWKVYIASVKATLDEASYNQLKSKVMGRARAVAEAAGGFIGFGSVSPSESKLLDELENSF